MASDRRNSPSSAARPPSAPTASSAAPASRTFLCVDGELRDASGVSLPLDDPGYLLGDGVFATMRGYEGRCFRARAHLEALARGAAMFGIEVPVDPSALARLADEAASRSGAADAYVRVTLTRGPRLSIVTRAMNPPSDDDYARGVSAVTVSRRRIPAECMDPTVKSTSYAPMVLSRREVAARGASEGVVLALDGALACGTMANLFVVTAEGDLVTPSLASGCRDGVTRRAVIELSGAREARLDPSVLASAREAFFTSTRVECLPIASVDGRPIGRAPAPAAAAATGARARDDVRFPRAAALRAALRELVRAERASLAAGRAPCDPPPAR
jgi:branched-chain amino acid aminotransferase